MTDDNALPAKPLRIAFVCNQSFALSTLYRGLFAHLEGQGFISEAVVGDTNYLEDGGIDGVTVHVVPMRREPSPIKDAVSLLRLIAFFARHRFDVVHVSTPKAALFGAIAARVTGHDRVLFVVRTRIYENMHGLSRWVYRKVDWLTSALSTAVAPISREIGEAMAAEGLCAPAKLVYFGAGSSNGIDVDRFSRNPQTVAQGEAVRAANGIPADALVLLSLGRLSGEKGIEFLPEVMARLAGATRETWLLIAGPEDWRDPADPATLAALDADPRIIRLGYQADPIPFYAAADLMLFPSRREGFGNVAIEAQAMGVPVIGFDTTGVREAVANGETGLLARLGDGAALAANALRLVEDVALRERMAATAVERVRSHFSSARIWADLTATLRRLAKRP